MYADSEFKARIARQFSRAACCYEELAKVQSQIAHYGLKMHTNCDGVVLDLGCGTGRISAQLATGANKVLGVDIARGMIELARHRYPLANTEFIVADAENLPLAGSCVDGVFSSMALQWCRPLDKVLKELFRVMKPKACGTLAIMAQGSLTELNQSWQRLGQSAHINRFDSLTTMKQSAQSAGFKCSASQQRFVSWHQNIFDVLHSIKDIGAGVLLEQGRRTLYKKQLQQLEAHYYHSFAQAQGLPLSYQVCFLQLQK
jgi:malonyl-CoA O-methyltransferase